MLLTSLDKLTIEENEFRNKISQILVACGAVAKGNRDLSEATV